MAETSALLTGPEPLPPRALREGAKIRLIPNLFALSCIVALAVLCGETWSRVVNLEKGRATCWSHDSTLTEELLGIDTPVVDNLDYVQARVIDIAWDLVVGQVGRVIQAWLLLRVASKVLNCFMEQSAVSYNVYKTIMFQPVSLTSLWCMREFWRNQRTWKVWIVAIWLLFSIVHVLSFPTLWAATTGYINASYTTYSITGGLANATDLFDCFQIADGSRIGLTDNAVIQGGYALNVNPLGYDAPRHVETPNYDALYAYLNIGISILERAIATEGNSYALLNNYNDSKTPYPANYSDPFYLLMQEPNGQWSSQTSSDEVLKFGLGQEWTRNSSTRLDKGILPYNSSVRINNMTYNLSAPLLTFVGDNQTELNDPELRCVNGEVYSQSQFTSDNQVCVSGDGFIWGFSGFLIALGVTLQLLWSICLYAVWLLSGNALSRRGLTGYGTTRTLVDLANVVHEELGEDLGTYTNRQLEKSLSRCNVGWTKRSDEAKDIDYIRLRSISAVGTRTRGKRSEGSTLSRDFTLTEGRLYG